MDLECRAGQQIYTKNICKDSFFISEKINKFIKNETLFRKENAILFLLCMSFSFQKLLKLHLEKLFEYVLNILFQRNNISFKNAFRGAFI